MHAAGIQIQRPDADPDSFTGADTAADRAGLAASDVIVAVNDKDTPSSSAVIGMLQDLREGDTVTVKVYRDDAFASQMGSDRWDMTDVGNGSYIDLSVTLRVVDNMQS